MSSKVTGCVLAALSVALLLAAVPDVSYANGPSGGGHASGGGGHFATGGAHTAAPPAHFADGGAHRGAGGGPGLARGFSRSGYSGAFRSGFNHQPPLSERNWHAGRWPRPHYGGAHAWFVPVLPANCPVYWAGGIPYYYYDNGYYTYNGADGGYEATEPPVTGPEDGAYAPADEQLLGSAGAAPAPGNSDGLFVYPRNRQNDAQTQNDRLECRNLATGQTGYDPAAPVEGASPEDFRQAMIACLDVRGYSAN